MGINLNKILNELIYIGFNIKHIGTLMLAETIKIIYDSDNINIINDLENNVYVNVAKFHDTNKKSVKGNIVNATNYMYAVTDVERLKKYFGFYEDIKPTPKLIVNTVYRKIVK